MISMFYDAKKLMTNTAMVPGTSYIYTYIYSYIIYIYIYL